VSGTVMDIFVFFLKELGVGLIVNALWHIISTYKVTVRIEKR